VENNRVSIFVSHKVVSHQSAARRIKELLESRAESLDVDICEEIPAGDQWRNWINKRISCAEILLVLLPRATTDLTWLGVEIGRFQSACPNGRLLILNPPSQPIPGIVQDIQVIETSRDMLLDKLLKPLYRDPQFVGLANPLNPRITDLDLRRDAEEIEQALLGVVDVHSELFGESLIVETAELDVTNSKDLDRALVLAPNGCRRILDWNQFSFSWKELQARAAEDKGKGTFWVTEMEQVIVEAARRRTPRVMTSTFRGRGPGVAGQIFRPQLECVDFVESSPVRYRFFFHEVLVPELVRGPERIGDVFNLIRIAARVRWEVLNPFLVKLSLENDAYHHSLKMSQSEQGEIIGRVIRSLRIIEQEVERHNMLDSVVNAFDGADRKLVVDLLRERERIHDAITTAAQREDFENFMGELMRALDLNCGATELLARRFLELVREDGERVEVMLRPVRNMTEEIRKSGIRCPPIQTKGWPVDAAEGHPEDLATP